MSTTIIGRKGMIKLYDIAKSAKIGETCVCPSCQSVFVKTNYQQAFCKTKSGSICKDKYWNTVTPTKQNNTTRISPANAAYMQRKNINAPSIVGGSGKISGYTSEGYRVMDGTAYDEFDDPVYDVDASDGTHPFDMGDAGDKE